MNAPESIFLPDVQSAADTRQLPIQHVGVRGLRYPLRLVAGDGSELSTVASISLGVGLSAESKGTHMSRFIELLEANTGALGFATLPVLLDAMLHRLEATSGRIELNFPYFVRKKAPVSGVESLLDYDVVLVAERPADGPPALRMRVAAPVTSLCPCSKRISDYGAHNQRSLITLEVGLRAAMSIEELLRIAEEEASCEVFGLLKRPDEKLVTERAYDNPKFVEDLVRDIALRLMREPRIGFWKVASENFESIHNHSAYAELYGCNA